MTFNSLTMNVTDAVMSQAQGMGMNWLYGNNPFGGNAQFYYNENGGGVLNVLAKTAMNEALSGLSEMAIDAYKKLLGMNKRDKLLQMKHGVDYANLIVDGIQQDKKYGQFDTGAGIYRALDSAGDECPDALMLGIPVKNKITLTQQISQMDRSGNATNKSISINSPKLVWYDTTAIITVRVDRNLLLSKVVGRDYSRKELVSNGDIEFSVSGTMSSDLPDVYPSNEIQKFIQVMQYKGAVEINNQFLDQFNISKIVIKSYDLPQQEAYKNIQKYTFTAVGIQPDEEVEVTEDTIKMVNTAMAEADNSDKQWSDMLKSKADGLKNAGADILSQGLSMGAGILNNMF